MIFKSKVESMVVIRQEKEKMVQERHIYNYVHNLMQKVEFTHMEREQLRMHVEEKRLKNEI